MEYKSNPLPINQNCEGPGTSKTQSSSLGEHSRKQTPLNAFALNVENIHSPLPVKLTATTGGNLTHNIFQFGPVYSIALFISISRLNECSTNYLLLCTLLLQWSSGEQPLRTVLKQDVREAVEAILILHRP